MSQPDPAERPAEPALGDPNARASWLDRRRDRIVAEIQRNRRGEYRVPTWVLAAVLALIVAGWVALIVAS